MRDLTGEELPGTALRELDVRHGGVLTHELKPDARYAWDTGVAIGRLLAEFKSGRLIGRRCHRCERALFPPRMFCEQCFRPTDEWVTLPDTGRVNTYSISHIRWAAHPLEEPIVIAVVDIDGTSHGGLLHYLGEVRGEDVKIGMPVKALWKPESEREGSVLDIRYFRTI